MRRLFDRLMPRHDNEVALDASPEPAPLPPLRGRRPTSSAASSSRGAVPPARTLRLPSLFQNTLPGDSDADSRSSIDSSTSDLDRVSVFRGTIRSGEDFTATLHPYIHTFMMPMHHRHQPTPPMQEIQDIVDEFQARYEAANGGGGSRREVVLFDSTPSPSPPPVGPTAEIDLTVSTDESDNETGEEEVQIVDTSAALSSTPRAGGTGAAPVNRRKRRRPAPATGESEDRDNKRALFDGSRAESTSISMENNDVIERFKGALKCSICLDVIEDMTSTKCGHVYCAKCIRLAIRVTGKCPLCQRKLQPHDIHGLYF